MFFDNFQVRHDRGRILEEDHYYTYGLKIAALSSKAFGGAKNNYLYQSDYSEFDVDLSWNDFMLRSYDPQIGRFLQWDPYDQFSSGYVGMGNDPGNMVDVDGGFSGMTTAASMAAGAVGGFIVGGTVAMLSGANYLRLLDPEAALKNADNFMYYILGLPFEDLNLEIPNTNVDPNELLKKTLELLKNN